MTARDYPISFAYAATSAPYSRVHHHKGKDYATPMGTAVKVGDTVIGYSGNSGSFMGQVYAPHLHIQAGLDEWAQQDIDPTPYTFKPGIVAKVGQAPQWGLYVCVRVGTVNVFYCHLSSVIGVEVGKEIKEETIDMLEDREQLDRMFLRYRGRKAKPSEVSKYLGKIMVGRMERLLADGPEYEQARSDSDLGKKARVDGYQKRIVDTQSYAINLVKSLGANDPSFKNKLRKVL